MSSEGHYYRFNLFNERKRYFAALLQSSEDGEPVYVVDSDFTDWARITQRGVQRLAQVAVDATMGELAWKLVNNEDDEDNNFKLLGGENTDETAAAAWIGGLRCTLYSNTDYKCELPGAFDPERADAIHHRYGVLSSGKLTDPHANFSVNALVGLKVQVGGAGEFEISGNTETELTLVGFDPDTLTFTHKYYYIALQPPHEDQHQDVYLDVHLEDWGMAEDSDLNHNPAPGTPVECMRRFKLVQMIWVDQRIEANPDNPIIAMETHQSGRLTYVDSTATRHWVFKLGHLVRRAPVEDGDDGVAIGDDDVVSEHEDEGGSPPEVVRGRAIDCDCLPIEGDPDNQQPDNLAERFSRGDSFITVGDGSTSRGMFNGIAGLRAAIACRPATIFLKRGAYNLQDQGELVVADSIRIVGESISSTVIFIDHHVEAGKSGLKLLANASIENVKVVKAAADATNTPAVWITGNRAMVDRCIIQDLASTGVAVLFSGASSGETKLLNTQIYKANQTAILTSRGVMTAIGDHGSVPFSDYPIGTAGAYIERCRITMGASDEAYAAVKLAAGVATYFCANLVSTSGPMIETDGTYISDAASPATFAGRDVHTIRGNLFLGAGGGDQSLVVRARLKDTNTIFESNVLDCQDVTAEIGLPACGILVLNNGPAAGHSKISDNYIRGAVAGIQCTGNSDHREILISRNTIVPMSTSFGNEFAISLSTTGAGNGPLVVEHNYLKAGVLTKALIDMRAPAIVRNNVLDGAASALVAGETNLLEQGQDFGAPVTPLLAIGIYVRPVGSNAAQVLVERNCITAFGSVGIQLRGGFTDNRMSVLGNTVLAQGRSLRGVWCEASLGEVVIEGNEITGTKREGIVGRSNDNHLLIFGNLLTDCGSGEVSSPLGANIWMHSSIRNGLRIERNTILNSGTYGIYSEDHETVIQGNTVETAKYAGVYVIGDNKFTYHLLVERNTISDCGTHAVHMQYGNRAKALNNTIKSNTGKGIVCETSTSAVLTNNNVHVVGGGTGVPAEVTNCNDVVVHGNTFYSAHHNQALSIVNTITSLNVSVLGNDISNNQGKGVRIEATGAIQVRDNNIRAGFKLDDGLWDPARRSICIEHVGEDGFVEVCDNKAEFGIAINYDTQVAGHGPAVLNNHCAHLGVHVHCPRARIEGNHIPNVFMSAKAHMVDASGVWYGYPDWDIANAQADSEFWCVQGIICDNYIGQGGSVGVDFTSDVGELGRAAGIMARGAGLEVCRNKISAANLTAIMLGWVDSPTLVAPKVGVISVNRVHDNSMDGLLVYVVGTTAGNPYQRITSNNFRPAGNSQTLVMIWGDQNSPTGKVIIRSNEAAIGDRDDWGVVKRQAGITLELGKTTAEAEGLFPFVTNDEAQDPAPLSDASAILRSNTMQLGADLS